MSRAVGERNPKAKLTAEQVVRLRERAAGNVPYRTLAREVGVSERTVWLIVHGQTWRHVGGPIRSETRPHRLAFHGPRFCEHDGTALEFTTDGAGRAVAHCGACERRRAGKCMDCGRRVEGKAWRCPAHRKAADARAFREYAERNREALNRKALAALRRETTAERARRLAAKKRWRERNPMKVAMQKRRARLEGRANGYRNREDYLAYLRDWRERRKAQQQQPAKRAA